MLVVFNDILLTTSFINMSRYFAKFNNIFSKDVLTDYKVILAKRGLYTPTLQMAEEIVLKVEREPTRNNERRARCIVEALSDQYADDKQAFMNRIDSLNVQTISGDINGDNELNVFDVILLLKYCRES